MLDEFLVFSDHHAHTFSFGAQEVPFENTQVNSRLLSAYHILEQLSAYAKTHKIKRVVFCGDMFHVRGNVPTVATSLMLKGIKMLADGCSVFMIPGNHDYADRVGQVHALEPFKYIRNVTVIDWNTARTLTVTGIFGDEVRYSFVPYSDDRTLLAAEIVKLGLETKKYVPHLLFAHLGMQGATVGSDYVLVSDSDVSVADVDWSCFTGCFFGHYHQHQQLFSNGWYVGATHHHTWGDANTKRGFLHVKVYLDHVEFSFVETKAPMFRVLRSLEPVDRQDFVRFVTDTPLSDTQVAALREKLGAEHCEVVQMTAQSTIEGLELSEDNLSPYKLVEAWVEVNASNLDKKSLISYGRKLLAT